MPLWYKYNNKKPTKNEFTNFFPNLKINRNLIKIPCDNAGYFQFQIIAKQMNYFELRNASFCHFEMSDND